MGEGGGETLGRGATARLAVLAALKELKQRQIGTIRTHMYRLKSTEGEETLKREVKMTHLKKNQLKNRQIVQTPISHSTLKVFWKSRLKPSIFCSLYYFSVTKITTLIRVITDVKKPKKAWTDLKKRQRTNTIQIFWIVKIHDVPNNSRCRFAAINQTI